MLGILFRQITMLMKYCMVFLMGICNQCIFLRGKKYIHHLKSCAMEFPAPKGSPEGSKKDHFFLRTLIVLILDMAGRRMRFTHSGKSSLFWSYLNYFI